MIVVLSPSGEPAFAVPAEGLVELGRVVVAGDRRHEVDDERMSREHATARYEGGSWRIVDRDSRNGTFVDGERISRTATCDRDVVVRLGHTIFLLLRDGRGHDRDAPSSDEHVVGPQLARAYEEIRQYAHADVLLVHGESGTGKELAALYFHEIGPRASGPFIAQNCAALPEGLAERLLFGSRRGAFSGATDAVGCVQAAHGGTLFLDEVADLELGIQAKLLRVLDQREVVQVGATQAVKVELGIVGACHGELREAVARGEFRDDLYYRLAHAVVHLPALRERKVDIGRLVARELAAIAAELRPHAKLIEACCVRPWPGNIRELRAAVRRAAIKARAADRTIVRVEDLPEFAGMPIAPADPRAAIDKPAIEAALTRAGGVVSVAARALGLHRTQLYRLMDRFGVARES